MKSNRQMPCAVRKVVPDGVVNEPTTASVWFRSCVNAFPQERLEQSPLMQYLRYRTDQKRLDPFELSYS